MSLGYGWLDGFIGYAFKHHTERDRRQPQRSIENVLITIFEGKYDTIDFPIYSFSMFERIKKYDENDNMKNVEKPYSIEVGKKRFIKLYSLASTRYVAA